MNPIDPAVEIVLGGKPYKLIYSQESFATAEYLLSRQGWDIDLLGPRARDFWINVAGLLCSECGERLSVDQLLSLGESRTVHCEHCGKDAELGAWPSMFNVGVLLFVGLIHGNRKMKLEDAQRLLNMETYVQDCQVIVQAATQAIRSLRPPQKAKQEAVEESPLAGGSGGTDASPSPATISESATSSSGESLQPSSTSSAGDGT